MQNTAKQNYPGSVDFLQHSARKQDGGLLVSIWMWQYTILLACLSSIAMDNKTDKSRFLFTNSQETDTLEQRNSSPDSTVIVHLATDCNSATKC